MKNNPFDLSGRRALVTGSSRGIGRAVALMLADFGAEVVVHGSCHGEKLRQTVGDIQKSGGVSTGVAADISSAEGLQTLIKACGSVDIIVLNASVQSYQSVEDFTSEEFLRQYDINVRSSFELVKAMLPGMKNRKWGRILSIGSVNQYKPSPRLAIYASTKAALMNLILNLARQYAQYGITANNIAPGVILTDRNEEILKDENARGKLLQMIPSGRFGTGDDCTALALLLCSNAGSYITGADIAVAGGMDL
ncbi:MAG: SDR family oxidoreductase [Victivallales bacterium]